MALNRMFEFVGNGLRCRRILVQRCSGLKRFMFLIGRETALPQRTLLDLNVIERLK